MSGKMRYTTVVCGLLTLLGTGCTHYAPFPELEEGVVSDEQNISYDDSVKEQEKKIEKAKETPEIKAVEQKTKKAEKDIKEAEITPAQKDVPQKTEKELIVPDPKVAELPEENVDYVIPSKTTPVVITDIDLTEMDAQDGKTKVIKPVSETKTILPVKKEQKVLKSKAVDNNAEPSVFYLAETVYFNNGGSGVDSSYYKKLRQVVKEAKSHNGKIIVQGFASSRTKNTDIVTHKMANLKVSVARAENVAKILRQYGMPKNRIITEGLSDSRPVYQEVMPEGERLNRRAEIYISY